jgi:hypothetical protein
MRKLLIAAVLAAQVAPVAAPAWGAELGAGPTQGESRMGAFAGGRLRIALGAGKQERVRAGLALAPALHRMKDGATRLSVGEGLEYGLTERRAPAMSLGGHRISDMQRAPDGRRHNVSTLGWVAIGVGAVVVVGVGVLGWLVHEANENTE